MNDPSNNISKLTDHLFRHESGKLVAVLAKVFGTQNLELAEDVLQETFISALQVWRIKGVPDNPSGWLFRSAKNKAIDIIRKNKFSIQMDFSDSERALLKSEYTLTTVMDTMWTDEAIRDDLLKMMFACCHKNISIENQITLILKSLCGFTTTEIAKAFLTSEETISKRLYRTKEFFREEKIRPEFPPPHQLQNRTAAVLKSIYLIFNEGYNSTNSDTLIRKDLLEQAMYLCGLLCSNQHTQNPEVYAAMALMCFHAARIESRVSSEGEIILLARQDRTKWDATLIAEGNDYMNKAAFGNTLSTYHIEAAIAYEHCIAETFDSTNWQQILNYYDLLAKLYPTAVVILNRMTVLYKIKGGLEILPELNQSPYLYEWEKHYLYHSLLGEIYSSIDRVKARKSFEKAITLTQSDAEQKLLQYKIEQL
ncbi:MAG: sigma-70 family polymerase sigma factor [Ferruginibacter sp.]|nr:sigma-70 family polymerase sigma factor [Ferruginibacter sp.]